jgi:hypothetical protein
MIDPDEFLTTIFEVKNEDEHILLAKQMSVGGNWRHAQHGSKAAHSWRRNKRLAATYFTVSSVREPETNDDGSRYWQRREVDCIAAYVVVLDDIGTKVEDTPKVEPTYKLESSEGNYQWGYNITPCEDLERYKAIVDALGDLGLSDKGAGGYNRVMRIPGSVNLKPGRGNFVSQVTEWNPKRFFELDDLAQELGVDLATLHIKRKNVVKAIAADGNMVDTEVIDPLLVWLSEAGHVVNDDGGDWVTVTCPWHEEHTTSETTAGYSPLGRGNDAWVETRAFKCMHEHCKDQRFQAFRNWSLAQGAPWTSGYDPLPWLQARYTYVVYGAEVADMHQRPHGGIWKLPLEDWSKKYYRRISAPGHEFPVLIKTAFLESGTTKRADGCLYLPGMPPEAEHKNQKYVNTYIEPTHLETDEVPTIFLKHIDFLCAGEADTFLDWLAHKIQFPGKRSYACAMVADDKYGTGRSWLRACLQEVLQGKVNTATLGQLVGKGTSGENNFNDWMAECQFLVVEEAKDVSREDFFDLYETFKERVDTRTVPIRCNPKYGRTRNDTMYFNCLIFTNHSDAMALPENDRRVYVIENPSERRDFGYYEQLERSLDGEEPARIYWYLMRRDVSNFDRIYPKMTAAKQAMVEQSVSQVDEVFDLVVDELVGDIVTRKMLQSRIKKAAKELEYTKLEASSGTVAGRIWRRLGTLRPGVNNGARYRVDTIQVEVRAVRVRENWLAAVERGDRDAIVAELKKNAIDVIGFPKTA